MAPTKDTNFRGYDKAEAVSGIPKSSVGHRYRPGSYPTVLVASHYRATREAVVQGLRQDRCLVLEAENGARVIHFAISHSRPIHVLLLDVEMDDPTLFTRLERYRPGLAILLVTTDPHPTRAISIEEALVETRQLLRGLGEGRTGSP